MNGVIVVNKPKGITSRDVVNKLVKVFGTKSIGHIGTLDPMATGVLVCLIGKYTKLGSIMVNHDKEYIATFKLNVLSDTLDSEGKVLDTADKKISLEDMQGAIEHFNGLTYMQEVPIYSAVKVNGKKLYDYARSNEDVILPKKEVTIYKLELVSFGDEVKIKCKVSKGTYIRALIRDICAYLGTYGVMTDLVRTKLGDYDISDAYSLDEISDGTYKLYSLEDIFDLDVRYINDDNHKQIYNGNIVKDKNSNYILYKEGDKAVAFYTRINEEELKPLIMF
jgi:tRNA pseudouridine55 synthase